MLGAIPRSIARIIGRTPNAVLGVLGLGVAGTGAVVGGLSAQCSEQVVTVIVGGILAALGVGGASQRVADKVGRDD